MTLYQEIDWNQVVGGRILSINPGSLAERVGIQVNDELLAVNASQVEDVIDVQYYSAEEELVFLLRRGQAYVEVEAERAYGEELGITFDHPTFDTDIRRCNNLCEFCFVLQMAPRFRRTLYIKDDDYRYSFLFGHFVTLTNLSDHDWWRIEEMGLSPLYISVHVTDHDMRRKFLRNPQAPDIMEQLDWLATRGIRMHTQLVIVPGFNDGIWLENSIRDLAELWPSVQSISVVPVGLTRHHKYSMRKHTPEEAKEMLSFLARLQPRYQERFGSRFVYPTDEWFLVAGQPVPGVRYYEDLQLEENGLGMVRRFLEEWNAVHDEMLRGRASAAGGWEPALQLATHRVTLVTGTLFADTLQQVAHQFASSTNLSMEVLPVINRKLGDSITVAGLLMGGDVLESLQSSSPGDLIVLPRIMFDHPDTIALDDISPQDIANSLKKPVVLADSMGDVWDALNMEASLFFYPSQQAAGTITLEMAAPDQAKPGSHDLSG